MKNNITQNGPPGVEKKLSLSAQEQQRNLVSTLKLAFEDGRLALMPPKCSGSNKPVYQNLAKKLTRSELKNCYTQQHLTGFGVLTGELSDDLECLKLIGVDTYKHFSMRMRERGLTDLLKRLEYGYRESTPVAPVAKRGRKQGGGS